MKKYCPIHFPLNFLTFDFLSQEIREKGIEAFPDKKVEKRRKSQDEDDPDAERGGAITAADLAALDFKEDDDAGEESELDKKVKLTHINKYIS